MKIAVYAIAKNEAAHVERFMAGVADADLVVVADTGSTDDTVELLRAAGASVHEIVVNPWRFDAARNAALALVPADVDACISLDLDEIALEGWRKCVEEAWQPGVTAASVDFFWGVDAKGQLADSHHRTRIHARHGYRWRHIVHEVLEPTTPDRLVHSQMQVVHQQDNTKNRGQYIALLHVAIAEEPSAFQLLCWLGRDYMTAGRNGDALATFEQYLTIPEATWGPERAAVRGYMRSILLQQGDAEGALDCQRRACHEAPFEREPWIALSQLCHDLGRWEEGYEAVARALAVSTRGTHYLVRDDSWGALPSDLASICAWNLGHADRARMHVIAALALAPDDERIVANARLMGIDSVNVHAPG